MKKFTSEEEKLQNNTCQFNLKVKKKKSICALKSLKCSTKTFVCKHYFIFLKVFVTSGPQSHLGD